MQLKIHILPNIISSANFKIYSFGHKSIFRSNKSIFDDFEYVWCYMVNLFTFLHDKILSNVRRKWCKLFETNVHVVNNLIQI